MLNSQILSGFSKYRISAFNFPFSTDSKTKLFFSFKKLSIKLRTSSSLMFFDIYYLIFFASMSKLKFFEASINYHWKKFLTRSIFFGLKQLYIFHLNIDRMIVAYYFSYLNRVYHVLFNFIFFCIRWFLKFIYFG